ncbi:MarR family winged helix-turn-helix transcriptional regulator [Novosphingobium profundi]|uniref:MarR family winged helix-turn-helix transcriptional regulator n=1 Tax=Novosphingobium profundi TaxID=1774954 RepID=UPI001FEAD146|nr:MarR family transcriptional regulator [Novosphingobium profundi]
MDTTMREDLRALGNPGSSDFRVDAYPFYQLNRVASRYNVAIESVLRPLEIDIPTWRVLMILGERAPLAIGQVSKSAVINLSTMMRIVERMAKANLVTIAPSASDGRVRELALTEHGAQKLAAAREATSPLYEKIIKGFSQDDFGQLLALLDRLYENLD